MPKMSSRNGDTSHAHVALVMFTICMYT